MPPIPPIAKKGPKGIGLYVLFLKKKNKKIKYTNANKTDINNARKKNGKPHKSPTDAANLMSPPPKGFTNKLILKSKSMAIKDAKIDDTKMFEFMNAIENKSKIYKGNVK